ncbi:MAG: GDP-mannose 4,6-dehydratase [candidate division WOR-3 bacterium]|nr:MAG: GDP-mannose 4,6-dehydratase [candidate division WOR-3 bacterium]
MSRVLVTGIEGFVGQHLARHLRKHNHEVIGLHFAPAESGLAERLYQGDVRDFARLKEVLDEARPEHIVHLAAVSSVAEAETHVLETYDVNAAGTLNLLEAARLSGLSARILLISSADVYGSSTTGAPLTEEAPVRPLSPYGLSKLAAEEAGRFSSRAFGMDVVILRPFSHTGPGQSTRFVFPTVASRIVEIEQAAAASLDLDEASRTIRLGNLDVRRDYTDVRDVVEAYALALDRCESGETYNVTSGRAVPIRDGVETLCSMARCEVRFASSATRRRSRDLPLLTGSNDKLVQATGWQLSIPLEQTLSDLLDHHRSLA